MNPIEELKGVIHKLHGATATHRESVPARRGTMGQTDSGGHSGGLRSGGPSQS